MNMMNTIALTIIAKQSLLNNHRLIRPMLFHFDILRASDVYFAWIVTDDAVVHDLASADHRAIVGLLVYGRCGVLDSRVH